ncbi:hypothetical protein E0L15_01375 [Pseudoflavonifractor sp. SW1122]|uniref:hypothetical protein n=1 Tax=Pseudoflavonifractor sp. SW1122 TaxID=2530044 RepID=UPI00143AE346|nr:hypothetical protein [Pseudoflavonifractor sp. SW1122]NJE73281.1 hypothetical protein [Pseudoflavonifractor sp. SW1122]
MEGQVFVPYTGIGGFNLNPGISTFSLVGSTAPGTVGDEYGNTLNIRWIYPGGITGKQENGTGFWGYAVVAQYDNGTYSTDETIKAWLLGQVTGTHYAKPEPTFNEEEIKNEDPRIVAAINELIFRYGSVLMNADQSGSSSAASSYDDFKNYFVGCYVIGRG